MFTGDQTPLAVEDQAIGPAAGCEEGCYAARCPAIDNARWNVAEQEISIRVPNRSFGELEPCRQLLRLLLGDEIGHLDHAFLLVTTGGTHWAISVSVIPALCPQRAQNVARICRHNSFFATR